MLLWQGGTRFFYLLIGLVTLMAWAQAGWVYRREIFRHWPLALPLLVTPILALLGIFFAFVPGGNWDSLFVGCFTAGSLVGVLAIFGHLLGVRDYVGQWSLRNFMVGPPILLPALSSLLSAAMLLVYFAAGVS